MATQERVDRIEQSRRHKQREDALRRYGLAVGHGYLISHAKALALYAEDLKLRDDSLTAAYEGGSLVMRKFGEAFDADPKTACANLNDWMDRIQPVLDMAARPAPEMTHPSPLKGTAFDKAVATDLAPVWDSMEQSAVIILDLLDSDGTFDPEPLPLPSQVISPRKWFRDAGGWFQDKMRRFRRAQLALRAEAGNATGGGKDNTPVAQKPSFSREELTILRVLEKATIRLTVDEIVYEMPGVDKKAQNGEKTVGKVLNKLIRSGYAARPEGNHKGAEITSKGRKALPAIPQDAAV